MAIREERKRKEFDPQKETEDTIEKGVIAYHDYGAAPESESWDGPAEVAKAEVEDLKKICAWYDSENADNKGAYKLPHHKADGHKAVWAGVRAAMGALLGARGGTDIPSGDRKGVYSHLAKEYGHWDKEVPEFKDYTDEELKGIFPELCEVAQQPDEKEAIEPTKSWADFATISLYEIKELRAEMAELKEGRVLSTKNRKLIEDAIRQMDEAIEAMKALLKATDRNASEEGEAGAEGGGTEGEKKEAKVANEAEKLKGQAMEVAKALIDSGILAEQIQEGVRLGLAKLRGKVE